MRSIIKLDNEISLIAEKCPTESHPHPLFVGYAKLYHEVRGLITALQLSKSNSHFS